MCSRVGAARELARHGAGDGQEVLVVDGDDKVQRGLAQLLADHGLVPTVVSDAVRARELAREKYFAVALINLDTPQTNAGLELTRWFKQNAPTTYDDCHVLAQGLRVVGRSLSRRRRRRHRQVARSGAVPEVSAPSTPRRACRSRSPTTS